MMMTFGRRRSSSKSPLPRPIKLAAQTSASFHKAAIDSTSRVLTSASASDEVTCEFRHTSESGRSLLNPVNRKNGRS